MSGSAMSELVLFIASIMVAGVVAGGLYAVTQNVSSGISSQGHSLAQSLKTNFVIINDPDDIPLNSTSQSYIFYVRNIGEVSFPWEGSSVIVMIDGDIVPPSNLTFININDPSISILRPYDVGAVEVPTAFVPSGYHEITVVLPNGQKRSLKFHVG
ncbi:MAG: flagellar protein G [Thermococci archaeon]|nr:flagellar protein G [Thermococci archaeon]